MKRLEKEVCESRKRYGASRCLQGQRRKEYMMEMENSNGWIGGVGLRIWRRKRQEQRSQKSISE